MAHRTGSPFTSDDASPYNLRSRKERSVNRPPARTENSSPQRIAAFVLMLSAMGCSDDAPAPTPPEVDAAAEPDGIEEANLGYLDEIAALGYVDFSDAPVAGDAKSGVVLHDPDAAWEGVNFITSLPNRAAFLVDMDGNVLHEWRERLGVDTRWTRVELLENGDVVCISPKENYLLRLDWNGDVVWRRPMDAHHDVRLQPDGNLLVLTRNLRLVPEIHAQRFTVDNYLTVCDRDGERVSERSLWDILSTVPEIPISAPEVIEFAPPDANVDPIHCNTAVPMTSAELAAKNPLFALGNVLVTLRYPCTIAMIDPAAGRVLWHWGKDELQGPHEASVMENGHILVLDNGWKERGYSRVLELDPRTGEILWEFTASEPTDFFTEGRGTAEALPNGNVLVGNSNSGEAFEVTRSGEVVWRYLNPNTDTRGNRAVLRIKRYPKEAVEAIRARVQADR